MAIVTTYTKAKIDNLLAALVDGGHIDLSGNLILELVNGSTINVGPVGSGGGGLPTPVVPTVVTLTDASTVVVNAALGNDFRLLTTSGVGSVRNIGAPSSPADGQILTLEIQQAASGGPYHVSWNTAFTFGTDGAPTLSTVSSAVDSIGFRYHAGLGKWICLGWKLGFS